MPLDLGEISTLTEEIFYEHLKRCARDEKEFDVYQNCAFIVLEGGTEYKMGIFRAIVCFVVQCFSLVFLGYSSLRNNDKSYCEMGLIISGEKILVVLFSTYIALNFRCVMYLINWQGCYPLLFYKKKLSYMNINWIAFGYFANVLTTMSALICAIVIMYTNDKITDIVLNVLSLFFIVKLDNYMISQGDYGSIKWDYLGGYWDQQYSNQFQGKHDKSEKLPFTFVNADRCWVIKLCDILKKFVQLIVIIAPIYFGLCY